VLPLAFDTAFWSCAARLIRPVPPAPLALSEPP
jgi:hypothetical protein